jgi:hypothetical protein
MTASKAVMPTASRRGKRRSGALRLLADGVIAPLVEREGSEQ